MEVRHYRGPRWLVCALALAWALCAPQQLRADAAPDARTEARTTFELGVEASRAQKWDEARAQFTRSLQLMPKASTMFNLAVADIKLGLGREALEQLDAFEQAASPSEHAQMLERAHVLRPQAQKLVDSEQANAEHGGNALSQAEDGFTDEVRQLVANARDDYAHGKDREALTGFEAAYKRSRRAELLYNIGVVADRMREDRRAARAYDMFLAALPDAPEAAVAQVRSDALHAAMAERERAGEEAARRSQEANNGPSPLETDLLKPRAYLVTGPVLIAASVISMAVLVNKKKEYDECLATPDDADLRCGNKAEVRGDRPLALVGIGASAAVLATGVIFTVAGGVQLARRKRLIDRAFGGLVPSLAAGAHGASLTLSGRF